MKKLICFALTLLLLLGTLTAFTSVSAAEATRLSNASVWDGTVLVVEDAAAVYTFTGEGTEASPYLIQSASDLAKLAANVNCATADTSYAGKYFKLTCDININNKNWVGIGTAAVDATTFMGNFDGDGHLIFNLSIKDQATNGLFGTVGMGAVIQNIGIASGDVFVSNTRTGTLIGLVRGHVTVSNCFSWANITTNGNGHVGGLIGVMMNGAVENTRLIKDCYYAGTLSSGTTGSKPHMNYAFGGIVGSYWDITTTFENCYFTGKMEVATFTTAVDNAHQHTVGGIAGSGAWAAATSVSNFIGCKVGGTITHTNTKADFTTYTVGMGLLVGHMAHPTFSATDCISALDMKLNETAITVAVGTGSDGKAYPAEMQPSVTTAETVSVPLAQGSKCFMVAVASDIGNSLELGVTPDTGVDAPVVELQLPTAPTSYQKYTTTDADELARYNAASKWDGTVYTVLSMDEVYKFEGSGTKKDPYLLNSADDVAKLAANVRFDNFDTNYTDMYFRLTCDIDLDGKPWWGIGGCSTTLAWNDFIMFSGIFDGDGHVIYNFNLANTNEEGKQLYYNGFFGYAGTSYCEIKNLGIMNGDVFLGGEGLGPTRTAALVGASRYDIILDNCFSKANMTFVFDGKGEPRVGGLMGAVMNNSSTVREIKNCYNEGDLTLYAKGVTNNCIGGIAGYLSDGTTTVENCYNTGDIKVYTDSTFLPTDGKFRAIGSIIGSLAWKGNYSFEDCVAGGTITYTNTNAKYTAPTGSVIGYANPDSTLSVKNCKYAAALKALPVIGEWEGRATVSGTEIATVQIPMSADDKYFINTIEHPVVDPDNGEETTDTSDTETTAPESDSEKTTADEDTTKADGTEKVTDDAAGCSSAAFAPVALIALLGAVGVTVSKKRR